MIDSVVVGLEECIKDYLDIAVFETLSRAPLKFVLDEFHDPLLKSFTLASAMAQNLIKVHFLQIFAPHFVSSFDDGLSYKVGGIYKNVISR